jgi:serine/threonine-protein kinase RsbW
MPVALSGAAARGVYHQLKGEAMDHLRVEAPCHLLYRDAVGALVERVCQRLEEEGAQSGLGYQVISAFNEAFNNLAIHAGSQRVEVLVEVSPTELALELRDEGPPYDYDDVPLPELDELPESGLGIYIMRSFMTSVHYTPRRDGGQNVLRMVRTLTDDPAAGQEGR